MFEVTHEELLRCKIGISSWGGSRYGSFAFTEIGVSMLSSESFLPYNNLFPWWE